MPSVPRGTPNPFSPTQQKTFRRETDLPCPSLTLPPTFPPASNMILPSESKTGSKIIRKTSRFHLLLGPVHLVRHPL